MKLFTTTSFFVCTKNWSFFPIGPLKIGDLLLCNNTTIDFFLEILLLKDDELMMSEM